jgi:hypothetical protein
MLSKILSYHTQTNDKQTVETTVGGRGKGSPALTCIMIEMDSGQFLPELPLGLGLIV